jgi:hypothetical protein
MLIENLWQQLEASSLGSYIAASDWAFPTFETLHVIAITTVFGTIAIMDLRLVGVSSKNRAITEVSDDTIKFTWAAFGLAVVTGLLLFVSKANSYMHNPWFYAKMITMALAGANMFAFNMLTFKGVAAWNTGPNIPTAAKLAGGMSLTFWVLVLFFGRMIGFTLGVYAPS